LDVTVVASGQASKAERPVSVIGLDADRGDRATHDIVHARPEEGIPPVEAGNATSATPGVNLSHGAWNVCKRRKDRETCHKKKVLSELSHFDSPLFFRLKRRNWRDLACGIVILLDIVIHPPSQDHALESARFMPLLKKSETAGKRRQDGQKIYWGSPLTKLTAGPGLRRYWA
jgi:hypothetical protein